VVVDRRKTLARFGKYRIVERLGEGGMCHVFRARHDEAKHDCALKLLKDSRKDDAEILDLFITEADVSMLLDHPNLVRTYDAGEIDGRYYIAMELIEGSTLEHVFARAVKRAVPLPQDFALYMISEVLEGLQALHTVKAKSGRDLGLVHRDITPSNVFLSFDGRVIVGDLGAAHVEAYGSHNPGVVLGKIGYLAPEAVIGEEIDRRADLFAAGVVLYELLTGVRLFVNASDDELMQQIAEVRIERPRRYNPHIGRELETVMLKALAKRPKDRFESAEEMHYAFEPYWSTAIGNPFALAALMAALYREEVVTWWKRKNQIPTPSTSAQ
jgi:serine/threonine-protein kinase